MEKEPRSPCQQYFELLASVKAVEHISPAVNAAPSFLSSVEIIRHSAESAGIAQFLSDAFASPTGLLIAVNDPHRHTDSASAIKAIAHMCHRLNLPFRFRLVIATGSHQFADAKERTCHEDAILGRHAKSCLSITWHDAFNDEHLLPLVNSSKPRFNRELVMSSHILAIGSLEPHYFAGITGAHKTLTVGLMSFEDITENHAHALSSAASGMKLKGNPIYEGLSESIHVMEESGKRLFAINEIMASGRLERCFSGHPLQSLHQALPDLRAIFCHTVSAPKDLIISIVHSPLDRDLYQADKGIKNVESAVRDGGIILLNASCQHGIGIDRFHQLLKVAPTYREAKQYIEMNNYKLGDHKAVRLRALTDERNVRIAAFAPGLKRGEAQECGIQLFANREDAVTWALTHLPQHPDVALVEDAGNITLLTM